MSLVATNLYVHYFNKTSSYPTEKQLTKLGLFYNNWTGSRLCLGYLRF